MRWHNITLLLLSLVVLCSVEISDGKTQMARRHFYLVPRGKVMPHSVEFFSVVTGALNVVLHA